ncbi:MAG: hypothetical protein IJX77_09615 [Ruminococcus sp.]|nr:hypothetical protein [Ruminococcus sp.]
MAETVGKLKRSALAHYLDSTFGGETPSWYLIGKDVEDMSIELNPNVETATNILDETSVNDNGYEPSTEVDTYYANPSDGEFYEKLKDIAMNRQTGEACRTTILEVLIDKTAAPFDAWTEDVIIKPQSYGGATGGVRIPYSITFCGNRRQGTVTITDRVPVFTETAAE